MRHIQAIEQQSPIIELNTTPLIDVMLVLLIMFIITIPIQTHAVKIELPADCRSCPVIDSAVNVIGIGPGGQIAWNGSPISELQLTATLRRSQQMKPLPELHLRPDPTARYGRVDEVLAIIKREHVQRFGFVGNETYAKL